MLTNDFRCYQMLTISGKFDICWKMVTNDEKQMLWNSDQCYLMLTNADKCWPVLAYVSK